jgi:trk system potassium uptake protein TrkH
MTQYFLTKHLGPNQVIILGFAFIIVLGTIFLALPISSSTGVSIGLIDALFTSTSAVCVTGLVVLETGSGFSLFGQIIILILIQIGGLGFMIYGVYIAILLGKTIGLKERKLVQVSTKSISSQSFVKLVRTIFIIAFILETIATAVLTIRWYGEMGLSNAFYHALFHTISAFNNAGFVLWSDSLSGYASDPTVNIVISSLFIITGLGFTVLLDLYKKSSWKSLSLHSKIVISMSTLLTVVGFLVILIMEFLNSATLGSMSWGERLWTAYFQSVTPRTAGFNTIHIGSMMVATQFFIILLMFIGASTGGTGGGIKTNTFVILVASLWGNLRGKKEIELYQKRIANETILRAVIVVLASFVLVALVTLLLSITENITDHSLLAILFEATSAFGTVGLSMGLTSDLSTPGKVIIIITMFIGRLGPLTFAYALSQRKFANIKGDKEGKVLIG